MANPFKFAVLVPYFGAIDWHHQQCMRELDRLGIPVVQLPGCPYIDIARAELVCKTIEFIPDVDILFWIDHDMIFNAKDVPAMAQRCWESDYAATAAGYALKMPGSKLTARPAEHVESITFYKPGLYDAMLLPLGFTAIKRHVFTALDQVLPLVKSSVTESKVRPYFAHIVDSEYYYGEDFSFFQRVRDLGFKVAIDAEPRVQHKGSYAYALEDCGFTVPNYQDLLFNFGQKKEVLPVSPGLGR